jgi:hypothetical protein
MVKNKFIYISFFLVPCIAGILLLDLAGVFNYGDIPFVLAFILYGLFVIIQRSSSNVTFRIALTLLLYVCLSYIPSGASQITERFGEWFYLSFFFGLAQYIVETWDNKL